MSPLIWKIDSHSEAFTTSSISIHDYLEKPQVEYFVKQQVEYHFIKLQAIELHLLQAEYFIKLHNRRTSSSNKSKTPLSCVVEKLSNATSQRTSSITRQRLHQAA